MQKIKKYLLFVFLIENLMAQVTVFHSISNVLFYVFMAIGFVCLFDGRNWSRESMAKFKWMYILMLIYIVYEFLVGPQFISSKTLIYLIAKITTFFIIMTSLNYNPEFYESKMLFSLAAIVTIFTLYGVFFGGPVDLSERSRLGFGNGNSTGAYGAIISGIVLFYSKYNKLDWKGIVILIVGVFAMLAAGSRGGMLALFMLMFFRYGVSGKIVLAGLVFLLFSIVILPSIGLDTVGMDRLIGTLNGEIGTNRDLEREAGIWMIQQSPWIGWGFGAKNQGYALMLSELPSHSGYIEMTKWLGYPTSIVWFLTIIIPSLAYWKVKRQYRLEMDFFFAMLLVVYAKAMYEVLFTGVHEFETNFFFFVLAILSSRTNNLKYDKDYTVNTRME